MTLQPNPPEPKSLADDMASPPTPMVYESVEYHWEYKQITLNLNEDDLLDESALNELGTEGWELSAVITHNNTAHYYFKRPAEET